MQHIIDQLIHERAPWLSSKNVFIRGVRYALRLCLRYEATLETTYRLENLSGENVLRVMSDDIARNVETCGQDKLPKSGAALIVANHPTGIADAIILYKALSALRPDLYFFANSDVLRVLPQLSAYVAPVEWRKEKRSKAKTKATLNFTKTAVLNERLGIIFPSGRLAKRDGLRLVERDWMTSAVSLAAKYDMPIVPVHIASRNSILFYILDLIHPTLRDITLFNETLNKSRFRFKVTIGSPVSAASLPSDQGDATEYMKHLVTSLKAEPIVRPEFKTVKRWRARLTAAL